MMHNNVVKIYANYIIKKCLQSGNIISVTNIYRSDISFIIPLSLFKVKVKCNKIYNIINRSYLIQNSET